FGAGHANYPGTPAYARPVELIVPSLVFGVLYLRLGLLPGIILHSAYDLVLMALPVFAASSPRLWDDKAIVVAVLLLPAVVVAWRRIGAGAWLPLPDALRNGSADEARAAVEAPAEKAIRDIGGIPRWVVPLALMVAVVGMAAGAMTWASRSPTVTRISARRADIEQSARQALDARQAPRDGWRLSSAVEHAGPSLAHQFVLETSGRDVYQQLLGTWLALPSWRARLARFDGPVEARAEEWGVSVDANGQARQVTHRLPEGAAGASLGTADAKVLASAALERQQQMRPREVTEVAATPRQLPHRTDWSFTWRLASSPLRLGELRYVATVAGDTVVSTDRTVYIPEDWLRARRQREAPRGIAAAVGALAPALLFFFTLGAAVLAWARGRLAGRLVLLFAALQAAAGLMGLLQSWPAVLHGLSTTRPVALQVPTSVGAGLVGVVLFAGVVALPLGVVPQWVRHRLVADERRALWTGLAVGLAMLPVPVLLSLFRTAVAAFIGQTGMAAASMPWLEPTAGVLRQVGMAAGLMLGVAAFNRVTDDWTRRRWLAGIVAVASVALVAPALGVDTVAGLAATIAGALLGLGLYVVVLRHDISLAVLIVGVRVLADVVQLAVLRPFPGARIGALLAAVVAVPLLWWVWRSTRRALAPLASLASLA
ncbi:MAG: hypothetical protein ACR2LU_06645, partial [Luteitalea sp.]